MRQYRQLTSARRYQIEAMLGAGQSQSEIALQLGCQLCAQTGDLHLFRTDRLRGSLCEPTLPVRIDPVEQRLVGQPQRLGDAGLTLPAFDQPDGFLLEFKCVTGSMVCYILLTFLCDER
jgi:hypothetical protein